MRVLALVHLYPPTGNAGAEWAMHTLLGALAGRGHDVDVLLTGPAGDSYVLDRVRVHAGGEQDAANMVVSLQPDVLVTHLRSTPPATVLGELYGLPVIHVLHNDHVNERNWLTRRPSLVVYNSSWVQASCLDWWQRTQMGTPPAGVVVRPPVIAGDYATTPGDRVTLVNVCANKGANTFWELARRLPEVPFLAVEGAYGEQVLHDLPNVDVQPHVSGRDMRDVVYSRTRILLMPSSYESWGRVGVEAMCSGIPVIAHPTPGLLESLGPTGVFADRDDVDGWEHHIRRLLRDDEWSSASERALQRAAELNPDADLRRWVSAVEAVAMPKAGAR